MQFLRAALGDDVDERSAIAAVLGLVVVEEHLHVGDGVEVDGARTGIRIAQVVAGQPVDVERVPFITSALDVGERGAQVLAHRFGIGAVGNARHGAQQGHHVAPADQNHVDLVGGQLRRVIRAGGLDDLADGGYRDFLGHGSDLERDVADRQTFVGAQVHTRALETLEALLLDTQRVSARLHRGEGESPEFIGVRLAGVLGPFVDQGDRRTHDNGARGIDHAPGNGSHDRLRPSDLKGR
jgi:hypothetical protein